jgi:hypothetical protein
LHKQHCCILLKDVEHGIMYNRSFQTQESGAGADDAKTLALIVQLGAGRSNKVCSIKIRTKGANFLILVTAQHCTKLCC